MTWTITFLYLFSFLCFLSSFSFFLLKSIPKISNSKFIFLDLPFPIPLLHSIHSPFSLSCIFLFSYPFPIFLPFFPLPFPFLFPFFIPFPFFSFWKTFPNALKTFLYIAVIYFPLSIQLNILTLYNNCYVILTTYIYAWFSPRAFIVKKIFYYCHGYWNW